jgi:hypothetical protein
MKQQLKILGGAVVVVAVAAAVVWLDPESVGIYNSHKEWVKDAYWCFQTEPAKMSKSELDHCDYVLKALGHGDPHRGIIAAVAELTGIDCDKEHDNRNLTEAALKQCSPIWWPGMITPSEK